MKRYETNFTMSPVLSDEQATGCIRKFRTVIENLGCRVLHQENWGLMSGGWMALFEYETDNHPSKDIDTAFKRDERILKFATYRLS